MHHIYAGYALLKKEGYTELAEICLSHSFACQVLGAYSGSNYDCTPEEMGVITTFLAEASYNDYGKLIQLCDTIGSAGGVCLMEKRMVDVVRLYGYNEYTLKKWEAIYGLKAYFDGLFQGNIYDLFYDEIRRVSFGS